MKSLENCQIVCNNAALATGPQPGSIVSPRGMRGASRREAWIERASRENFVQEGHCKYCDSRNRQSAVYFGLLLLLRASPPAAPPLCDSGVRSEKGRTPTRLLSPSNLSSRFFSRNKRRCLVETASTVSLSSLRFSLCR